MPPLDFELKVTVEASVSPSEDPSKVRAAVSGLLGECAYDLEESPKRIAAVSRDGASLLKLHDQLRDRHVRAAARRLMITRREGRSVTLLLNRQAASAGVLALCGSEAESPLGPIYLTIESGELDDVMEWLTAYEAA